MRHYSSSFSVFFEAGFWREATAPDGRIYYWYDLTSCIAFIYKISFALLFYRNTVTRESRWEKPKELTDIENEK